MPKEDSSYAAIYAVVRAIPRGRVATYGQVARLAGLGRSARLVGYALHALPDGSRVPWQRVVNAGGGISPRSEAGPEALQRVLLEQEGVVFGARGRVDLRRWQWRPGKGGGSQSP
jgi:methylated-DNA-protein-cysteine methyltransferase-like protein